MRAQHAILLAELKIDCTKVRKAANGGTIIEIFGPNGAIKANALADKLRNIFKDEAKLARPVVKGEIRLVGLDDSVGVDEVTYVVAQYRDCTGEEVKVGPIRPLNNGLYTVWVQCPLSAALKIATGKKIKISWTLARVDLLDAKPVQCFKCCRFGHVRQAYISEEDLSGHCFRCGGRDYLARNCSLPPFCKICFSEGKDPKHRLGSICCSMERKTSRDRSISTAGQIARCNPVRRAEGMILDEH